MKLSALFALIACALSGFAFAADSNRSNNVQTGELSTVRILATARGVGNTAPDGMRFLFLITRKADTSGQFTLKETRDFLVGGTGYQEKTHSELGKRFEPGTVFDTAENFFSRQPGMRGLAPDDIKGAYILSLAIGGAKLSPGTKAEVTIQVGFDKQVEPFTFGFAVPPVAGNAPKRSKG